jgi:hypothetical protein
MAQMLGQPGTSRAVVVKGLRTPLCQGGIQGRTTEVFAVEVAWELGLLGSPAGELEEPLLVDSPRDSTLGIGAND